MDTRTDKELIDDYGLTDVTVAIVLWNEYRRSCGGKSKFTGDELPDFHDMDEEVQGHWLAVGRKAVEVLQ